jgi:hypothetical protein
MAASSVLVDASGIDCARLLAMLVFRSPDHDSDLGHDR